MKRLLFLVFSLIVFSSCGDPVDVPEDCTRTEYFDDAQSLCFACPPLYAPSCTEGCGFEIAVEDSNSTGIDHCPIAECVSSETCDLCEPNAFFSDEKLMCMTCIGPKNCEGKQTLERTFTDGNCYTKCQ